MKKKSKLPTIRSSAAEYLTFIAATGDAPQSIEMRYEDENIWLTQKMLATLYDVEINTINYHLKNIFEDYELEQGATIRKYRIVQNEGNRKVSREVEHYNLQMIIAIGFKVENERAVQFRKWANNIVKEYTIQGWAMDTKYKEEYKFNYNRVKKWIKIEQLDSYESYKIMESFVENLPEGKEKEKLSNAIQKRKPFANFNNLINNSKERENRFKYRACQLEKYVIDNYLEEIKRKNIKR